jgi:Fe-S-cluster containining protein
MDFRKKFYDITNLVQQEFDRNLELYGDKIQCRRGCSKCCSQIFRITPLDGWIITEYVRSLPAEERNRLIEKAREYLNHLTLRLNESLDTWRGDTEEDLTTPPQPSPKGREVIVKSLSPSGRDLERGSGFPCPALGSEGECTIYDARPVICRRFGMPIYDYKNPDKVHSCDLNFKDGEEITDPLLIPNQTEIGRKWDEVKEEYNTSIPPTKGESVKREGVGTTIAEAIVAAGKHIDKVDVLHK